MSLFGGSLGRKKPGSFFDPEPYYGTPGYGGPLPGQQGLPDLGDDPLGLGHPLPQGQFGIGSAPGGPLDPNRPPQTEQVPAQPQRWVDGGKFGWKDAAGLALGAIGDAFTTQAGGQAQFAPHLMQGFQAQRAAKAAEETYNRRRADENTDWTNREKWKLEHATPEQTAFEKNLIAAGIDPRSEQGRTLTTQYVTNQADPIINITTPEGQYTGPSSQWQQPAPQQPQTSQLPSREEYGRFVKALRPDLQTKAWGAYDSGNLGGIPMGNPTRPNLGSAPQLPPKISSPDELARLPSGTEYIAPDGLRRRKR